MNKELVNISLHIPNCGAMWREERRGEELL
jgi:hypothetical protein